MEIYGASLRAIPAKGNATQPISKLDGIQNKAKGEGQRAVFISGSQVVDVPQPTAEIGQRLLQKGLDFSNQLNFKEVFKDTIPTHIQHALDAYQNQHSQLLKNQRVKLIAGIDFYA